MALLTCFVLPPPSYSYKILNPAAVEKEKDPQKAAQHILDAAGLDADLFRLGHTKACLHIFPSFVFVLFLYRETCLLQSTEVA